MKIDIIAGARPNFMKIAPIIDAIGVAQNEGKEIAYRLVHTGQHYDKNMSMSFFNDLGIPEPDVNLNCGGGSQAEQTANIMLRFESDMIENPVDLVLVVGDVTSTLACSIVAKKMCTKVAHVEAGIRSGDLAMPEEINRMVTDSIADYFFTTSEVANHNLRTVGIAEERIFFVGNTMIDTLVRHRHNFRKPCFWEEFGLQHGRYLVVTLHRPANVDEQSKLMLLLHEIMIASDPLPVVFPVHPRTAKILTDADGYISRLHFVEPMGYLEFNYLVEHSTAVVTDSGGITEETSVLGIPCMTLRNSTERPETISLGTNELLGTDPKALAPAMKILFSDSWKKGGAIPLWDGKAASRIVKHLLEDIN